MEFMIRITYLVSETTKSKSIQYIVVLVLKKKI